MTIWPFRLRFPPERRRPGADQLTILGLGAAALILPFFLTPSPAMAGTHTQLWLPPCLFLRLTSIPCATCGLTTSFAALAHGQIGLALRAHPFGAVIYIYTALITLAAAGAILLRRAMSLEIAARAWEVGAVLALMWAAKLAVWYLA